MTLKTYSIFEIYRHVDSHFQHTLTQVEVVNEISVRTEDLKLITERDKKLSKFDSNFKKLI